jgi:hypothetical protein
MESLSTTTRYLPSATPRVEDNTMVALRRSRVAG